MPVIDCIKRSYANAVIARCSEMGCTLKLDGLSNYVVLKGERICRDRKICDCIVFTAEHSLIIGIIELKSRTAHPKEIEEKLTNGSAISLDILERCADGIPKFEFYHLVLSKSWRTSEYVVIVNTRINVRGKKYYIIAGECGISFSQVIAR